MRACTAYGPHRPQPNVDRDMSTSVSEGPRVSNADAVPLATALVEHVARRAGIRTLALKGPLAYDSGLRPPRASTDVDVLVSPNEADALITALESHGWTARPWPQFPTLLPPHSRSLLNPQWAIDIDVHFNWPGFLAPPDEVFDTLWARRREMTLAETPVTTTGLADTALILALHILREAPQTWEHGQAIPAYDDLVERVTAQEGLAAEIRAVAADTGAEQTARPFLQSLGFEVPETEPDDALHAWHLHGASVHPVSGWLNELARVPLRQRPAIVWRAMFPSASDLRAIDPTGGDGPWSTVRRWWRRLKRGIRTAPSALRTLRNTK